MSAVGVTFCYGIEKEKNIVPDHFCEAPRPLFINALKNKEWNFTFIFSDEFSSRWEHIIEISSVAQDGGRKTWGKLGVPGANNDLYFTFKPGPINDYYVDELGFKKIIITNEIIDVIGTLS